MNEMVLVTTYHRPEMLFHCLKRIRDIEPKIPIAIFPDRGTYKDVWRLPHLHLDPYILVTFVPEHNYFGNSYNTMEAFRWGFNQGFGERTYLIEDDVMVHPDFFKWHREMHEELPDIFCSMAWIFNRVAPITDDVMFQPWYYSIGTCFTRKKLELIARHASPLYYEDMAGYVSSRFKNSPLNDPTNMAHFEQDGLIQRILDEDKSQTVSPGIAKCSHVGLGGYNRGWHNYEELFVGAISFEERIERLSDFIADPYARAAVFGRDIVEREIGHALPKREFKYRIKVGEFESELVTELDRKSLPQRLNSVPRTPDMQIMLE